MLSADLYLQQVQRIKLQLLVKEYSPLPRHEPSIGGGGLETAQVNPWDKYPLPYLPPQSHCSMKQLDESSLPLSPTAGGCLSQRGDLLGLET
jgi:hypothetical protein